MTKKVTFSSQPVKETAIKNPDEWVQHRATESIKRLTLDVPASLHRRIKLHCTLRDTKMAEEIRVLLEKHYKDDPLPQ